MGMRDLVGLLCVVTLLAVLGGGVLFMLYGVRGAVDMVR